MMIMGVWISAAIGVLFAPVHCQQPWGCQERVASAMKDYKDCVDYTYNMLFGLQYQLVNGNKAEENCKSIYFVQCQQAVEQKLSSCLDYVQRETLQTVFQVVANGIRYWCVDYARNLLEFYNRRGPDCYYQHQSFLRNCEAENPLVNTHLTPYDFNYCRIQSDVIACIQTVYEKCLTHENPQLIRGYLNAMWSATPCNTVTSALELRNDAATQHPLTPAVTAAAVLLLMLLSR